MIKLERLNEVAQETLGGLNAGPGLLRQAMARADGQIPAPTVKAPLRRGLAFALSALLVLGVSALALPALRKSEVPTLPTLQAGQMGGGIQESARDLPRGSVVLSPGRPQQPGGVWAPAQGANFPLIRTGGRFYRMLTSPQDASSLAGSPLGSVETFTGEPSLDTGRSTLSNAAAQGAAVSAVPGMGGAAVTAEVGGTVRLFQRVSYAGSALLSGETLRDTLPGGATALQLSGVGTVTDPGAVGRLMDLLYGKAVYQGSHSLGGGQALLVQYPGGAVLQMAVKGDSLSACGTWSCPEFLSAFAEAAE